MIFKDYYRILELKSNKVSLEQIKITYRELAKKYHPDVNMGNKDAEERFKDITEAYTILSDANSKKKYDRMWNSYVGNKKQKVDVDNKSEKIDFFTMFFGNLKESFDEKMNVDKTKKVPEKGDNIETEVNVTIKEAFYGKEKKISLRTIDGKLKTFLIKVPSGIRNKEKMRLIGQGKNGKNGGRNGDLFIKINIDNSENFKLEGYDIRTIVNISPWEAVFGAKIDIEGIDEKIKLYVPKGTGSGQEIKINDKGYQDGKGGRGSLIVETKIVVPYKLTDEEQDLFEKLKMISKFKPRKDLHNV